MTEEYEVFGNTYTTEELHIALENDDIKEVDYDDDLFYDIQDELENNDMNEIINKMIQGHSFFEALTEMGFVEDYDGTYFVEFENAPNKYDGQYKGDN